MPNSRTFQNSTTDISIEARRFLTLPYYYPDSDEFKKSRQYLSKLVNKHGHHEDLTEIRAFCVIFELDGHASISEGHVRHVTSILKLFVHTLVTEEIRDSFVARESHRVLSGKSSLLV